MRPIHIETSYLLIVKKHNAIEEIWLAYGKVKDIAWLC